MTLTPAIRVEFIDTIANTGKVWIRDPADETRWIDVSHYVTAVQFNSSFAGHNQAQITFIKAATGAP